MMRRSVFKILAGFIGLAVSLGCGFADKARAADKIKLALHWNAPTHQFLAYYAAIKLGYYKEQNLDVEMLLLPGSVPAVLSVSAGDAQIGQASSDAILVSMDNGAPLKAVFLLYQQTPTGVIVFKESGIKSFAQLRGKTVATSVASPEGIMLNARLRDIRIDPEKDLHILNVAPAAKITMQLSGQADASTGFADFQLIQAQMRGREVEFLPFSTKEAPLYGHAVFVNTNWLDKNPDVAKRFMAATVRGLNWAHDNFDQAVDMVVKWDPSVKIDPEFSRRGWQVNLNDLISSSDTVQNGIGHMQTAGWANLVKVLKDGGMLKTSLDPAKLYTNDYIPQDVPKW